MHVVILGAGIAGSAAALALRSLGFGVDVYERRSAPDESSGVLGAGVVCWPNATFVLGSLGLLDTVTERGHRIGEMRRVSADGVPLGSLSTAHIDDVMGFPSLAVSRAELHELLLERAQQAGARFHFGVGASEVADEPSGTAGVRLSDGTVVRAELILGADGRMNSIARAYVAGDATPRTCGFTNWLGTVRMASATFEPGVVFDAWGVGARFGVVPLSTTQAYWAAGLAGRNAPDWRARFEGWPQPISAVLTASAEAQVREIEVFDHDPLPCWHRRNVLVLGDAAHAASPTSGQGVGQALEDVWHLRRILATRCDVPTACAQLFEIRSPKTTAIMEVGRTLARSLFDTDASRCRQRDARSAATDFTAAARGVATLWSRELPLPDAARRSAP